MVLAETGEFILELSSADYPDYEARHGLAGVMPRTNLCLHGSFSSIAARCRLLVVILHRPERWEGEGWQSQPQLTIKLQKIALHLRSELDHLWQGALA